MNRLADRISKAERQLRDIGRDVRHWHRIIWEPGQRWADALAGSDYRPGDSIIVRRIVDAVDGRPVRDPVHEADRASMEAFA